MSCLKLELIERYAAGALDGAERAAADSHFASCQRCRAQLAQVQDNLRAAEQIARARADAGGGEGETTESVEAPLGIVAATSIPGYEIIRELSRGGQGVVYQAVQKSTKRKVAVKVLLEGPFASASGRKRFEREIDLVAQLQHANIVTIFDSGTTPSPAGAGRGEGVLWFAMDYVRGTPLHHYVRENKLTLEQTLKLFGHVCEAVQYAHQRGVIHRDLKPTNILVDAEGVPRVLDFGLAKQMAAPVDTVMSMTGQVVGTLPYMSPEQARGSPDHIDTRTDVYALGVILYELLTGHYPYQVVGNLEDVLRNIRQTPPTPPSRSWRAGAGVDSRSDRRRRGRCPIDEEVETIVMKCLTKERERRYQSAGELGKDLAHYLADEPIEARRDSGWYVLKKTLQRYKVAAGVVAGFVLLISVSTVALSIMYRTQRRATSQAVADRNTAEQARIAEAEQRTEADRQRDQADKQRREAEFQAYAANIGAADAALAANDAISANLRLDRCPPELRNWEWKHLKSRTDNSLATLRGHTDLVYAVAFSPDGQRLASASQDKTVKLWDTASGAELLTLRGHASLMLSVAFSPDGRRLASGAADGTVKLWNTSTGADVATLRAHTSAVHSVAFSTDGQRLASGSEDNTAKLWDSTTGVELLTLRGHTESVTSVAFSTDGQRLASASLDSTVRLWDATSGAEILTLRGHTSAVSSVAFSQDGERLASASWDNTVKLWDASSGAEALTLRGHTSPVISLAFGPDGQRLASACRNGRLSLWDVTTSAELLTMCGHTGDVCCVAVSPDGKRLASSSSDNTVKLWDTDVAPTTQMPGGGASWVTSVTLSSDLQQLASGRADGAVTVCDAATGAESVTLRGHAGSVTCVAFSADRHRIASAADDKTVKLWDTARGAEVLTLRGHSELVFSVAFSPDGRRLASASGDAVRLWDTASGAEILTLRGRASGAWSVAFSPDGQRLASASMDDTVTLWNTSNGREIWALRGHTNTGYALAFSPDGRRLASASQDNTVKLWDTASGAELFTLRGHTHWVSSVAFSRDGQRLASGSWDETVKLWDVGTGTELLTLRAQMGPVRRVAFDAEGQVLAWASASRTRLWHVVPRAIRESMPVLPAVDALFAELGSPNPVLDRIRADPGLAPDRRPLAEKAVLIRSTEFGAQAFPIVSRLFQDEGLTADVIDLLRMDGSLSRPVRTIAIQMAQSHGEDPDALDAVSWAILIRPMSDTPAYGKALRCAEAANRLNPEDRFILTTLGIAQYRTGQYEKALATLTRADQLNSASQLGPLPVNVAFLAMSLHRLGRSEDARAALERMRALEQRPFRVMNKRAPQLLQEAEALIEGNGGPESRPARQPAIDPERQP